MYKADFYITQAAPEDSGKKYTFTKLSGWGELLEAPGGEAVYYFIKTDLYDFLTQK